MCVCGVCDKASETGQQEGAVRLDYWHPVVITTAHRARS